MRAAVVYSTHAVLNTHALQTEPADESKDIFFSGYAVSMAEDAVSSVYLPGKKRKTGWNQSVKYQKIQILSDVRRNLSPDKYFLRSGSNPQIWIKDSGGKLIKYPAGSGSDLDILWLFRK